MQPRGCTEGKLICGAPELSGARRPHHGVEQRAPRKVGLSHALKESAQRLGAFVLVDEPGPSGEQSLRKGGRAGEPARAERCSETSLTEVSGGC